MDDSASNGCVLKFWLKTVLHLEGILNCEIMGLGSKQVWYHGTPRTSCAKITMGRENTKEQITSCKHGSVRSVLAVTCAVQAIGIILL